MKGEEDFPVNAIFKQFRCPRRWVYLHKGRTLKAGLQRPGTVQSKIVLQVIRCHEWRGCSPAPETDRAGVRGSPADG